jgi:hypothetical protein
MRHKMRDKLAHGCSIPLEKGNKIQRQDQNQRKISALGKTRQNSTPGPECAENERKISALIKTKPHQTD